MGYSIDMVKEKMSQPNMDDSKFLSRAIELSKESVGLGGFPVGAILVDGSGIIVGSGISNGKKLNDPTSHAETAAIREASKKKLTRDLKDLTLYSSMEPCLMCYSASFWANIHKIVFAISRDKLAKIHFEGNHNLTEINERSNRQIELTHLVELEQAALNVIEEWTSSAARG